MWELYLISRVGVIHNLSCIVAGFALVVAIVCFITSITTDDWSGEDLYNEWQKSKLRKFAKTMLLVFGINAVIGVATPSREEAYFIYGVGGTIDYIQSNPKAKQIPDKCIDALNRWVDNLSEKEENK